MNGRRGRDGSGAGGRTQGSRPGTGGGGRPHRPAPPPSGGPRAPSRPARVPPAVQVGAKAATAADPREVKLYGVNACRAFFAHRRERIIRAYFSETVARRHFAALMKWLAANRLAYHLVTDDELERISGSGHHEGVCLLVRVELPRDVASWLRTPEAAQARCLLALENVGNPHNLGAILRVAAHFGVPAVLVPDARALAGGSAVRTAEGGAEFVEVLDAPDFAAAIRACRQAGWRVVTTSSHKGTDLYRTALPEKCLVLFGEESAGLSDALLAGGDACIRIPGTGKVESLNVSVAAGVLVGEWWRQMHAR
jgi:TrmH RNA methyltransferase